MDMSSTIRRGHPAAFGVFIVLSLIVAIIASAVAADLNKQDDGQGGYGTNLVRDTTRFMVFTGWWSFLVGVIFLVLFLTGTGGVISSIAVHGLILFVTWIFWLCGSAALSNAVGNKSCSDPGVRDCDAVKAILAFGWIGWIELTFLLGVIGFLAFKAFRGGRGVQQGF